MDSKTLARSLGWFSIGLGLAEAAAPKRVSAYLGMEDRAGLVRGYGFRELATGVGVLTRRNPAPGMWARVAGDALDLATLGSGLANGSANRRRVAVATGAVAGITVLDVVCAQRLSRNGHGAETSTDTDATEVERSLTIGKPVEEVYRRWREPQTLPQVMAHVAAVTPTGEDRAHWVVRGPLGRTLEWDTRIVEERPNELIRWESLPGADLTNEGTLRFRPAPGDLGTVVTLRLRFVPPGGTLGVALKLTDVVPSSVVGTALRRFKSLIETGEIPTLDHNPSARGSGDAV